MQELAGREIGARIALARKEAGGMTQDELADLLGVTMRSVQNYEAGDTIPWRHFKSLEEIFQKPLAWFLHGEVELPPSIDAERVEELFQQLEAGGRELRDELARRHDELIRRFDELAEQFRLSAVARDRPPG